MKIFRRNVFWVQKWVRDCRVLLRNCPETHRLDEFPFTGGWPIAPQTVSAVGRRKCGTLEDMISMTDIFGKSKQRGVKTKNREFWIFSVAGSGKKDRHD